jgi:ankyrin repeat protein
MKDSDDKKNKLEQLTKAHRSLPRGEDNSYRTGGKVTARYINGVNINVLFLQYVKEGNALAAKELMGDGLDVNAQDEYGMTPLHYAAAMGARPCIRLLVNSEKCDYLIQDNKGRYASELAFEWAKDYAVGVLLSKKQAKQAYGRDTSV